MKSLSKIIKSSRLVLGEDSYKISSEITIPVTPTVNLVEEEDEASDERVESTDAPYTPESLIEQAEHTALQILDDAQKQSDEIVEHARESSLKIEEEAMNKAKELYDNSKAEGHDQGFAQGYQSGEDQSQVLIDEALMIKDEWLQKKVELLKLLETESVKLVVETCEKIVGKQIDEEDYILSLIENGLNHLSYAHEVSVRVCEEDYEYVVANRKKIMAMLEQVDDIAIKVDMSMSKGDCVIETETGIVDVGVQTQLDQVKNIFESLLASE